MGGLSKLSVTQHRKMKRKTFERLRNRRDRRKKKKRYNILQLEFQEKKKKNTVRKWRKKYLKGKWLRIFQNLGKPEFFIEESYQALQRINKNNPHLAIYRSKRCNIKAK